MRLVLRTGLREFWATKRTDTGLLYGGVKWSVVRLSVGFELF